MLGLANNVDKIIKNETRFEIVKGFTCNTVPPPFMSHPIYGDPSNATLKIKTQKSHIDN